MTPFHQINAVILAGGLGSRLRDVVSDRPKVLAEVNRRPFLEYLLKELSSIGIRRSVVCTGYLAEQIEERFGNRYGGMTLSYSRETTPLGTGGALRLALPLIDSEQVMVLNGDSFCAVDYGAFLRFHLERGARMSLCLASVPDISRYGAVRLRADGAIASFEEKGRAQGPGAINAGIYLMGRDLLAAIPEGKVSLEQEVIPGLIDAGLFGFNSGGRFIDIGVPADYSAAQGFFAAEK